MIGSVLTHQSALCKHTGSASVSKQHFIPCQPLQYLFPLYNNFTLQRDLFCVWTVELHHFLRHYHRLVLLLLVRPLTFKYLQPALNFTPHTTPSSFCPKPFRVTTQIILILITKSLLTCVCACALVRGHRNSWASITKLRCVLPARHNMRPKKE